MIIEEVDALRTWLTITTEPICDADPAALARYVMALLKKDKTEQELKQNCIDQLEVFLQKETISFVDRLFDVIHNKSYISATKIDESTAIDVDKTNTANRRDLSPMKDDRGNNNSSTRFERDHRRRDRDNRVSARIRSRSRDQFETSRSRREQQTQQRRRSKSRSPIEQHKRESNDSGTSSSTLIGKTETTKPERCRDYGDQSDIMHPDVAHWLDIYQSLPSTHQCDALSALISSCTITQIRHLKRTIEPYFQKDFISLLPKEIALQILSLLCPTDVARAAQTCRYWRTLTEDNKLWKEKCQEAGVTTLDDPRICNSHRTCYARSRWKSTYLRYSRVQMNWRRSSTPIDHQKLLRGHDEHVITCLQICGDTIVSGSDDNTLRVWSVTNGTCIHTLSGHTGGVWSSQMSLDGRIVISGSTDRSVRVWSTETGQCLHTLQGHTSTVRCMSLRKEILVSGSRDTTLRIWNIETGQCVATLTGHVAAVRCVQFDGKRIVSGAYDYTIKVWDASSEQCIHTLSGHTNRVYSLLFDSDRDLVVSGSLDTHIRVWDISKGICLQHLIGHQSLTSGMQLRANILVSGNADSTVKVWNIKDGQCLHTLAGINRHHSAVTSLQFLESGMVVTSSDDGTVKLWDAMQGIFLRDLVTLESGGSGGCIWRLKATQTTLVCAVGSRNGTEDTKLILLDFDADYP